MHADQHIAGSEADQKGHCAALAQHTAQVPGRGRSPRTGRAGGPGTTTAMDMTRARVTPKRRTCVYGTLTEAGIFQNGQPGPGTHLVRLAEEIVEGCWLAGTVFGNIPSEGCTEVIRRRARDVLACVPSQQHHLG